MRHASLPLLLALSGCGLVDDLPPASGGVRLNELMASGGDWIELVSLTDAPVDLAGWIVGDDGDEWALPAGATLPPRGHYVVACGGDGVEAAPFGLSADGERIFLMTPSRELADQTTFEGLREGESWGRHPDGEGEWGLAQPTRGLPNAPPRPDGGPEAPQVTLNEVGHDFVELYQRTGDAVDVSGWRLAHGAQRWDVPQRAPLESEAFLSLSTTLELEAAPLRLLDASGALVDEILLPEIGAEQSFGRTPDGGPGMGLLATPSPGATNLSR